MKEFTNEHSDLIVLKIGEELHEMLGNYAREHELKSAWVEGLGSASDMTLGYYKLGEKQYSWKDFSDAHEILSLQGNLAWIDDEPVWHIHGVFGNDNFNTVGGHVKELTVGPTCELHITPFDAPLTRIFDDETGLKLLS